MKFSVIVPVYNVEKYIKKCILSIINQKQDDYELIIVDDGSVDRSIEIIEQIFKEKAFTNFVIIRQKNKGLGGARNTGISIAKGDYLVFVDSDDYLDSSFFSTIKNILLDDSIDVLRFNAKFVDEKSNDKWNCCLIDQKEAEIEILPKDIIINEPTAWNKVYRRKLFIENSIFYPEHQIFEDLFTTPKLAPFIGKQVSISKVLYYYVQRDSSLMHAGNQRKFLELIPAVNEVVLYYKNASNGSDYSQEIEWLAIKQLIVNGISSIMLDGYLAKESDKFMNYVTGHFPGYQMNQYYQQCQDKVTKNKIDLLFKRKFFSFYLKYVLKNRIKAKIKGVIRK